MAELDRSESARWAQVADAAVRKLKESVDQLLSRGAARGFAAPPVDELKAIVAASQEAKMVLVDANHKIYDLTRQDIFDRERIQLKIEVALTRLVMELYRVRIFNALELEQATIGQQIEENRADVDRWIHEIERRQVHIIRARAQVEESLLTIQRQLLTTQQATLPMQRLLVEEQFKTAVKKLEIIDSIYKVLAAEQLVLAAERHRAASLEQVLAAHRIIAEVKRGMIPYYLQKANAEILLAGAVTLEAEANRQRALLGFDKIRLQWSREEADHATRGAELDYEIAKAEEVRANKALQEARAQAQITLANYSNNVRSQILAIKKVLSEYEIDLSAFTRLARVSIDKDIHKLITDDEISNISLELSNFLKNLETLADDQRQTIRDSASTITMSLTQTTTDSKKILKGSL